MLQIKNTIACPGCGQLLRVSARVVSDGKDYSYYLCPRCVDIARQDGPNGEWTLQSAKAQEIPEIVRLLQTLAMEDWKARSTGRIPALTTRAPAAIPAKERPQARVHVFRK